jgi:hypothetical protein
MSADTEKMTQKLMAELGIANPEPALVERLEGQFSSVILEVLLRRVPEEKLSELQEKFDADDPGLEEFVAEIAAGVPGLAQEIEAAVAREYEMLRSFMKKTD